MLSDIQYDIVKFGDIELQLGQKQNTIVLVKINGTTFISTNRFITSLCAIYGFSPSIFNYFTPKEVIERIASKTENNKKKIRIATEGKQLLAASKLDKPIVSKTDIDLTLTLNSYKHKYHMGVVTSHHKPKVGSDINIEIDGDIYQNRYILEIPVDGYGHPSAYLILANESSDIIPISRAFKSKINLGKKQTTVIDTVDRFINSFNNEEGFAALRDRLEAATQSPASLDEFFSFYEIITSEPMYSLHLDTKGEMTSPYTSTLNTKLRANFGSLETYGVVSYDSLSKKKRRVVPTSGTVYRLIKAAAEISTELSQKQLFEQQRAIQVWLGELITSEYDLEGVLATAQEDLKEMFSGDMRNEYQKLNEGVRIIIDDETF